MDQHRTALLGQHLDCATNEPILDRCCGQGGTSRHSLLSEGLAYLPSPRFATLPPLTAASGEVGALGDDVSDNKFWPLDIYTRD